MKRRAQQLWIPGLLTMAVSTISLIAFQRGGFHSRVVSWNDSRAILLFVPWLLSLPLLGALGAYLSSRAGGSRGTALLASVFPALAFTGALLFMFPIGLIREPILFPGQTDFGKIATDILKEGLGWIVVPGAALLIGGLLVQFFTSRRLDSRRIAGS